MRLNGLPIFRFIKTNLESGKLRVNQNGDPIVWKPENGELIVSNSTGIEIRNAALAIEYETTAYIGLLSDLNNTILFKNLTEDRANIFYMMAELRDYQTKFQKMKPTDTITIPAGKVMKVHVLVPEIQCSDVAAQVLNTDGTTETVGNEDVLKPHLLQNPLKRIPPKDAT